MKNNRINDTKVEREIAHFLDLNLYSNQDFFKDFRRTDEKNEQLSGSDIVVTTSNGKIVDGIVDEKVATRYANTNLNTFSLELSFINRSGNLTCGWFLDPDKKTEYYLLGWILKANIPYDGRWKVYDINKDNIEKLEWALVSRKRILEFLKERGWTMDRLFKQDEKIRKNGKVLTKSFVDDISFRYSDSYVEKPINVLLKKSTYISISELHGIIEK